MRRAGDLPSRYHGGCVGTLVGFHSVLEALRAGHSIDRVLIARGAAGARLQEIIDLCRSRSIALRFEPRASLDGLAAGASHQGVLALGAAHRYASLEGVIEGAKMLVALDGVEDPHNLGAIIRTAHAAGADAVLVPERRAAGLTETVAKAAAGALEYLPVVRVGNMNRALETLKERGFWIYGLDERGDQPYDQVSYASPGAWSWAVKGRGCIAR